MKTKLEGSTRTLPKRNRRESSGIVEWSLDPKEGAGRHSLLASCGRGDSDVSFDEPEEKR
jgi:hypothetical protein